ncbi:MAG: hypothetical protein KC468_15105, partial [Myxococcales bacterium]|nr:hypothetical protein [Myxococcales bacterium]
CEAGVCGGVAAGTSGDASTSGGQGESSTSGGASEGTSTGAPETSSTGLEETTGEGTSGGEQCSCQALDVLLVYDQAQSMLPYEDKIIGVLVELYEILLDSFADVCSYHVGLTFTSEVLHNDPECQGVGSLLTQRQSEDCSELYMGGKSYVDETDDLAAALLCLVSAGSTGAPEEQNSRTALAVTEAISPELNAHGACNEGFFRADAALAITFVTAEDDNRDAHPMGNGTPGEPSEWFTQILELNAFNPDRVGVAAIIPPAANPTGCMADPAPRLHEWLEFFVGENTIALDLCDDEQVLVDIFTSELQQALFTNTCAG